VKKLLISLFFTFTVANGLFAMFSSENNGCFPEEGFRFKNRTVRYNKDLRLVIPKECQEQELCDWVQIKNDKNEQTYEKRKVIKKEIKDKYLLDDEGNLIIAKWFASKRFRTFREPYFQEETVIQKQSLSSYNTFLFFPEEIIQHKYNDEYGNYRTDHEKARNKEYVHLYIQNMCSQQGIWTYIRGMRIIEWLFGQSQSKIKNAKMFTSSYGYTLDRLKFQEIDELTRLLELTEAELDYVKSKITTDHKATLIPKLFEQQKILATNELQSFEGELQCRKNELEARQEWGVVQERLERQKELLENEIESLKKEKNHLSFVRSTMKRSKFNMYQKFRQALARE